MRTNLADSLDYVAAEIADQMPRTALAERSTFLPKVSAQLRRPRQRVCPAIFSAYFRLIECLTDDAGDPLQALDDLHEATGERGETIFKTFDDAALGSSRMRDLYRRALDTDATQPFSFLPPEADASTNTSQSITRALALMRDTAPELAAEITGLINEIVLAAGARTPGVMRFDGASSYQLWGALALNVDEHKSDLEMMETLAHEAGHSFLFGMTIDEPLVWNSDDELHKSPLRADPRPMDGIYHATWVSARMHYAMRTAYDSDVLDDDQRHQCDALLDASRRAFEDGDTVIRAEADLSATGAALIDGARRFMAQ